MIAFGQFSSGNDRVLDGNVLTNDTDEDGDPLTVTGHTDPSHGTLELDTDGALTYTPVAGYVGADSFEYTITDGTITDTATVSIDVTNEAPVAADDGLEVSHDRVLNGDALTNDSDEDGDSLTVTGHTDPSHGTLELEDDGSAVVLRTRPFWPGRKRCQGKRRDKPAWSSGCKSRTRKD